MRQEGESRKLISTSRVEEPIFITIRFKTLNLKLLTMAQPMHKRGIHGARDALSLVKTAGRRRENALCLAR